LSKISERIEHCRIIEGYCQICGVFGKLSADHVPPQGSITLSVIEQKNIMEYISKAELQGVKGKRGSVFKTICGPCNSKLGLFDMEIKRVSNSLGKKIRSHFTNCSSPYNLVTEQLNVSNYLRGMVGHILASTSVRSCLQPIKDTDFYKSLREFVLGKSNNLDEEYDVYYWFYPNRFNISGGCFAVGQPGSKMPIIGAVIYFYPVAIFIGMKADANPDLEYRNKILTTDKKLYLNVSTNLIAQSVYPFMGKNENTILLLNDSNIIVSYPIKS
jgi:hypothetical protein